MRLLCLLLLSAVALPQSMPELIARFQTDRSSLQRFYSMRLVDARYERVEKFLRSWLERLGTVDFDGLEVDGRVDYVLLRTEIEYQLKRLARERKRAAEARKALPFAATVLDLEGRRRNLEPVDPERAAARVAEIASQIPKGPKEPEGAKEPKEKVEPEVARRLLRATRSLGGLLQQWYRNSAGFDPQFTWWVKAPYESARKALEAYGKRLDKMAGSGDLKGEPIGREAMLEQLEHEMLPYSPEELVAMADRHYAWCEEEMKRASRELGLGDDWKKALEHTKGRHVPPGQQAMLVAELSREAIAFCDQHDLVTIPPLCREFWRTEMISAQGQRNLPFASYGGQRMNVAFATDGMTHEGKLMSMRGNNRHFTRLVTPHELIPGHHLQGHYAAREKRYRSLFRTPFLVEGWAVYGEMLFWKLGFARSPEDRIGNLFWRMHRCARINVSLGYHLGKMTPEEMIQYLVDRIGHERDNATAEVRRYVGGSYGPLYQAGYLVGALQFRALRKEVVDSGKMTDRAFHDAILVQNSIPVEMIRAAILKTPLERDHKAAWKFGGG